MRESQAVAEEESKEPCVTGVDYAESILTTSYSETRPRFAVDDNCVPEVLWLPLRVYFRVVPNGTHEDRTVRAEATIEHDQSSIEFVTAG